MWLWGQNITYPIFHFKNATEGPSLVVQWLGLHISTARGMGWIPGWETAHHTVRPKMKNFKMLFISFSRFSFTFPQENLSDQMLTKVMPMHTALRFGPSY